MRNILLIAKREYLEQVRGRAFRFSTVLVPLLIVVLMGGNFLMARHADSGKHIAIMATNPCLAGAIRDQLLADKENSLSIDVPGPASQELRAALLDQVRNNSLDGLLTIDSNNASSPRMTYTSLSSGDMDIADQLRNAARTAIARQQLLADGINQAEIDRLYKTISIDTQRIDKQGNVAKGSGLTTMIKIYIMLLLILMPILLHGMDMARAIIEEKSSRIFEVMLSVSSPEETLAGKLLGTGAVGLTQIVIWIAAIVLASSSAAVAAMMGGNFDFHISIAEIVFFVIYFVLGFLFYSAIFSGLGATCETAQDLQMYASLIVLPAWLATFAVMNVVTHPGSPWNVVATLCPITSPFVVVPRLGLEAVPIWQLTSSLLLLILSLWAALWFSSRLYRVGILMYGKRATLPELVRWLRYS